MGVHSPQGALAGLVGLFKPHGRAPPLMCDCRGGRGLMPRSTVPRHARGDSGRRGLPAGSYAGTTAFRCIGVVIPETAIPPLGPTAQCAFILLAAATPLLNGACHTFVHALKVLAWTRLLV